MFFRPNLEMQEKIAQIINEIGWNPVDKPIHHYDQYDYNLLMKLRWECCEW